MRIAGAEFAATAASAASGSERGKVDVLQPDINRCGGLTEIRRIAELASHHGAEVVPHGWKTGITAAAERHFQAATVNSPMFEFLSPLLWDSPIRLVSCIPSRRSRMAACRCPWGPASASSSMPTRSSASAWIGWRDAGWPVRAAAELLTATRSRSGTTATRSASRVCWPPPTCSATRASRPSRSAS